MIWDDDSQAKALMAKLDQKIDHLNSVSKDFSQRLESDKYTEDQKDDYKKMISGLTDRVSELKQSKNDIDQLGNDQEHKYILNDKAEGNIGGVTKTQDGKVSINAPTDGLAFHEMKHVVQSLNAKGFLFNDGKLQNAGKTDEERGKMELSCYKTQFSYNGNIPGGGEIYSPNAVTSTMVGNMKDQRGNLLYPFMNQ